jgi:transcription-repair coupling factor (superfamily II helicase)
MMNSTPSSGLASLAPLLRDEPGLTRALGQPDARLAIVEVARPIAIAGLGHLSDRRPLVVVCPTGTMAGQLADDLRQFMGPDEVLLFPAWETLPFERISPAVETMGRRVEVIHRIGDPATAPKVVVTGIRALLQKLAPGITDVSPIRIAQGASVDPDELVTELIRIGYRREELVEHRGEFARRGAIIDIYPSTADAPIRVDLWGDEVDRLTRFSVSDQRSVEDLTEVEVWPARELIMTEELRRRRQ